MTWADLFNRATESETTVEVIRASLARHREEADDA